MDFMLNSLDLPRNQNITHGIFQFDLQSFQFVFVVQVFVIQDCIQVSIKQ